ncbi:MAG: class I SAM-dependent methyltransferase [Desulfobacteraceae bacterium]|jgi:SAM-dependent methyltransferase|nr:class I SAM-dependent methyltransferase [Desulfobacteraceae bacterium]
MPKIEAFQRYSDAYDAWFQENADKYEAELALIRRLLPPSGARGMEVGIGSGKFAVPFGIRIGVEPSREMALKARQHGIQVIAGVAEHLPLSDDCFDFVLMVTTICFVDDAAAAFAEAHRVLKPGGGLIVGFVDKESDLGRRYDANRNQSRFYREATFFSTREVMDHLEAAGFRIDRIEQTLIPGDKGGRILEGFGQGAFVGLRGVK